MNLKIKLILAMLIPSCLVTLLGYGMIITGNSVGYAIEIIGAILSYVFFIKLVVILTKKKVKLLLIVVLTIFYISDILLNSYYLFIIISR